MVSYRQRVRVLKLLGCKEWTGWYRKDVKWNELPRGIRELILKFLSLEKKFGTKRAIRKLSKLS